MACLLIGNEPYAIDLRIEGTTRHIENKDMNIMHTKTFDDSVLNYCNSFSFSGCKKLVIYKPDELKSNEILIEYLRNESDFTKLLIVPGSNSIDKRTKLYKLLQKNTVTENKYSKSDILDFIILKTEKMSGSIERNTAEFLINRLMYLENEDVTIYDILSNLNKLVHYSKVIKESDIELIVKQNMSDDVFKIIKFLLNNDHSKALQQLNYKLNNGLNAINFLALLMRNFRVMYKIALIKDSGHQINAKEIGVPYYQVTQFLNMTYNVYAMKKAIDICNNKIIGIKNGLYLPSLACNIALAQVCCTIAK